MKRAKIFTGSLIVLFALLLMSFGQEKKPWDVPDKYKAMKNPNAADDADALKLGKMTYAKHCKSCHGNFGQGDGPKARSIDADLGDFTTAEFKALKDGVIYYMSIVGRDDMPNFEKKITDEEERWAVITYIKSLKK
ncbi:c-type cytochrome [Carboxylicivirga caseinilyticus]|uniref:c-type cytochrome n=1 Tax=Carboxylicivirga caseinilyticus TaxID=3417572 RepID=UPI003D3543AD|nr:c-type cytochrome [Marinilabiliaceae bacterium A049]